MHEINYEGELTSEVRYTEEELKKMSGLMLPKNLVHPSDADTGTYNYSMFNDIIIL